MHSRWARVARGGAAATFATFAAAFAHTLAGDRLPSVTALLATLTLSFTVCVLLAGKSVSLLRLSLGIFASQAMYHFVFATSGNWAVTVSPSHHGSTIVVMDAAGHEHGAMWVAHLVAAVVTVVAFRYGEGAFWGILATAKLLLHFILRSLFVAPTALGLTPPRRVADVSAGLRSSLLLLSPMRHRGPPRPIAS